jgi:hypothetical protein
MMGEITSKNSITVIYKNMTAIFALFFNSYSCCTHWKEFGNTFLNITGNAILSRKTTASLGYNW